VITSYDSSREEITALKVVVKFLMLYDNRSIDYYDGLHNLKDESRYLSHDDRYTAKRWPQLA